MKNFFKGSKSPEVNADENIQQAVEILNVKDYPAKYDPNCSLNENKPTITFDEFVHNNSFHKLPKGWISVTKSDSEFLLSFNPPNGDMQSAVFAEASVNLLKWAQELEKAVLSVLVVLVPLGVNPSIIAAKNVEILGLFNPYAQLADDGEPDKKLVKQLLYCHARTPQADREHQRKMYDLDKKNVFHMGNELRWATVE